MKNIGLVLIAIIASMASMAQDNDTSLLRKNHVQKIEKMQYIHAFESRSDTCIVDVKELNESGKLVYHKSDLRCSGWSSYEESFFTFHKGKLAKIITKRNGEKFSRSMYSYKRKVAEPVRIKTFFYQTNDSMSVVTRYYKNRKGRMDSSMSVLTTQDGSEVRTKNNARYNKDNALVQLYTLDESGAPLEMLSNEIDKNGTIKSVAYTRYGDNASFSQTFYKYNDKGQIDNTVNTVNQKQVYRYDENGLITNVLSYNPKGALEIEFIYKYTYHK
ncbi:MAG: hypothetical protein ACPGTP_01895 [Bacteroidia bacterium]